MVHLSEYSGRVEEIYLPEDGPTELGARTSIADAEQEARKADSQPLNGWIAGRERGGGVCGGMERRTELGREKAHMGYYAAIARALDVAADRAKRRKLGRVRVFTDAQAVIKRMTHDEPGPGQTYTLQARQAITALRKQEPAVEIEIRWRPAHKGIPGNEVADGWAKQAASEPDDHGVE